MTEQPDYRFVRSKPSQARGKASVKCIMNAAAKLFVTKSIHTVTTNEIAKAADVPVGLLYRYFENREAVVMSVVSEHLHALSMNIESIAARKDLAKLSWYEICHEVLAGSSQYVSQHDAATYLFAYRGTPALRKLLADDRKKLWLTYASLLSKRSGHRLDEPQLLLAATLTMTMLYSSLDLLLEDLTQIDSSYEEITDQTALLVARHLEVSLGK